MEIFSRAPGKLVYIGDYAVLEGAPAIVSAVNRYAQVRLKKRKNTPFRIHSPTLHLKNLEFRIKGQNKIYFEFPLSSSDRRKLQLFINIFEYLMSVLPDKIEINPLEITLDTDHFFINNKNQKLGLGSSAALTVAIILGLLHIYRDETKPDRQLIYELADQIHFNVQGGKGSGIDIAASSFGGILKFHKDPSSKHSEILPLTPLPNLKILPVWSGYSTSTSQMIEKVYYLKKEEPKIFSQTMDKLMETTSIACEAFMSNKLSHFLEMINEYFAHLKTLGEKSQADIISEVHQRISEIVHKCGGCYKPSGAGGGDLGLVFADSIKVIENVSDMLLHSRFQIINLSNDQFGPKTEVVHR